MENYRLALTLVEEANRLAFEVVRFQYELIEALVERRCGECGGDEGCTICDGSGVEPDPWARYSELVLSLDDEGVLVGVGGPTELITWQGEIRWSYGKGWLTWTPDSEAKAEVMRRFLAPLRRVPRYYGGTAELAVALASLPNTAPVPG
jgi:hypothetical protein